MLLGRHAAVSGGSLNLVAGYSSFVAGGSSNTVDATAPFSFVAGELGKAIYANSAVLAFTSSPVDFCESEGPGTVSICAAGLYLNGEEIAAGGGGSSIDSSNKVTGGCVGSMCPPVSLCVTLTGESAGMCVVHHCISVWRKSAARAFRSQ